METNDKAFGWAIGQERFGQPNLFLRREFVVLVGPPCVGKSTYCERLAKTHDSLAIVSRDAIVETVAAENGLRYEEMFSTPPKDSRVGDVVDGMEHLGCLIESPPHMTRYCPVAYKTVAEANTEVRRRLDATFAAAIRSEKRRIMVDMTSITTEHRKEVLSKLGDAKDDFHKAAVVFILHEENIEKLLRRLEARNASMASSPRPRVVPAKAMLGMVSRFEPVTAAEGFDVVVTFNTFK